MISNKLLILILSLLVVINLTIAFSYHMMYENWLMYIIPGVHHTAHRVIMIYHSMSGPFIGIVTLFFLEIFEIRRIVVKPLKYIVTVGGLCAGIGATFWAYTDLFILHHVFVVGLALLFLCGVLLFYGLIPGEEVKRSDYYETIPKIGGLNLLHMNALIIVGSMLVFAIFGALAAIMMLEEEVPFFFVEVVFLVRDTPKTLYQELASFHMRLMSALFLTGILVLIFRYTEVRGKAAKIGLWLLLPGTVAMTAGYFLMIFMGKAANSILMPARGLILFTGVIIALSGWIQVSKEHLGEEYKSSSWRDKIIAVLKNPLRFGMFIPFFLAGFVVVIPGLVIVADLEAYRSVFNYAVEREFATGHPHTLITLGAIVIFCVILHNLIPKNKLRMILGWSIIASQLITFPAMGLYFLRSPTDLVAQTILKSFVLVGLFLLLAVLIIYLGLVVYLLISDREKIAENIRPLFGN